MKRGILAVFAAGCLLLGQPTAAQDESKRAVSTRRSTTAAATAAPQQTPQRPNALADPPLLIGAFNAQIFGQKKASDPAVMDVIAKIVSRYDILLLQEIRDISSTAAQTLLNMVNRPGTPYSMVISGRLGRTTSKEQYAFYYRSDKVKVNATYQFPDDDDWFQREPFTVRFSVSSAVINDFAIMAIHTEPGDAVNETSRLVDVYDTVRSVMSLDDVLIAGDFNADCNYISGSDWKKVRLWNDPRFVWLIGSCSDTTATDTDCAYDRFVAAGSRLQQAVVPGSAQPYIYNSSMPSTNVSDHYPVEVALAAKPDAVLQQQFTATLSITIKSRKMATSAAVASLRQSGAVRQASTIGFQLWESSCGSEVTMFARSSQTANVTATADDFDLGFPGIINDGMRAMLISYFQANNSTAPIFLYGLNLASKPLVFDVVIECPLTTMMCALRVDWFLP